MQIILVGKQETPQEAGKDPGKTRTHQERPAWTKDHLELFLIRFIMFHFIYAFDTLLYLHKTRATV